MTEASASVGLLLATALECTTFWQNLGTRSVRLGYGFKNMV